MLSGLCSAIATQAASGRTILLRGQPDDWPLRPTFLRAIRPGATVEDALAAERAALDHVRSQAHLHSQGLPLGDPGDDSLGLIEWWSLMQHHRAPTRLLDWTASPYVAAYFAVAEASASSGVVLVIDADALNRQWDATFGEGLGRAAFTGSGVAGLRAVTPFQKTARLVAQQGYFTVATGPLDAHDDLLNAAGAIMRRWVIPVDIKPTILLHLRTMNVTANSLFPGLDGLGRSATELVRTAGIK